MQICITNSAILQPGRYVGNPLHRLYFVARPIQCGKLTRGVGPQAVLRKTAFHVFRFGYYTVMGTMVNPLPQAHTGSGFSLSHIPVYEMS